MELKRTAPLYSPIEPDSVVSTCHAKVAPMGPRRIFWQLQLTIQGNVIEESPYFPGYWLVYWFTEKTHFYVNSKFLRYISSATVTQKFKSKVSNKVTILETVEQFTSKKDEDLILLCVLNNKIHCTEGYRDLSIDTLVNLFSSQFPFMTKNRIQRFITKYRPSRVH